MQAGLYDHENNDHGKYVVAACGGGGDGECISLLAFWN